LTNCIKFSLWQAGNLMQFSGEGAYSLPMAVPLAASDVDHGTVLILITLAVLPVAAIAFARSGKAWRDIGRGPYAIDPDLPPTQSPRHANQVFDPFAGELDSHGRGDSRATKEAEVRQMVEAQSYRRTRRGEAPLDVEAEVRRRLSDSIG
jgi:hypothetical protein